jgi:hypothetical protein
MVNFNYNKLINMDQTYLKSLKSIEKVFYKAAYEFHLRTHPNATTEEAHAAGVKEISRYHNIRQEVDKPRTYVNLATGEHFVSTERFMS